MMAESIINADIHVILLIIHMGLSENRVVDP